MILYIYSCIEVLHVLGCFIYTVVCMTSVIFVPIVINACHEGTTLSQYTFTTYPHVRICLMINLIHQFYRYNNIVEF